MCEGAGVSVCVNTLHKCHETRPLGLELLTETHKHSSWPLKNGCTCTRRRRVESQACFLLKPELPRLSICVTPCPPIKTSEVDEDSKSGKEKKK